MMRRILFGTMGTIAVLAAPALAADADGKDAVKSAAKKLADAGNYSWKQANENAGGGGGGGGGRGPGAMEGKAEKNGLVMLTFTRRDNNTTEVFLKDGKGVVKTDDGWKTLDELTQDNAAGGGGGGQGNPQRFMARMAKNFKPPTTQAETLADKVKELKKSDDAYEGELSEDGAKELLAFGGRGGPNAGNGNAPEISNAKGTAKFWTKEGMLTKFEYNVKGTISRNGNERQVDRTTTVEIKDVGTTKVEVPEEARKKLPAERA